jgi:hypothetical protein
MAGIPTMELIESVRPRMRHRFEEFVESARARLKAHVAAEGPSALSQGFETVLAELTVVLKREDRMAIPLASQLVQGPVHELVDADAVQEFFSAIQREHQTIIASLSRLANPCDTRADPATSTSRFVQDEATRILESAHRMFRLGDTLIYSDAVTAARSRCAECGESALRNLRH